MDFGCVLDIMQPCFGVGLAVDAHPGVWARAAQFGSLLRAAPGVDTRTEIDAR